MPGTNASIFLCYTAVLEDVAIGKMHKGGKTSIAIHSYNYKGYTIISKENMTYIDGSHLSSYYIIIYKDYRHKGYIASTLTWFLAVFVSFVMLEKLVAMTAPALFLDQNGNVPVSQILQIILYCVRL